LSCVPPDKSYGSCAYRNASRQILARASVRASGKGVGASLTVVEALPVVRDERRLGMPPRRAATKILSQPDRHVQSTPLQQRPSFSFETAAPAAGKPR